MQDEENKGAEYVPTKEACRRLGISHYRVSLLVAEGSLTQVVDKLDRRRKLISITAIKALLDLPTATEPTQEQGHE
jgi:hypothetical protein